MLFQCNHWEYDWPVLVTPPRVVVLDRHTTQGRRLLNRAALVQHVWEKYKGDVEVVGSGIFKQSLPQVFSLIAHASVLVTMHGTGAALLPLLRANAVVVHIVHHPALAHRHQYVHTWVDALAVFSVNISVVQVTLQDTSSLVVREDVVREEAWYVVVRGVWCVVW